MNRHEQQLWETYRKPNLTADELSTRLAGQKLVSIEALVTDKDIDFQSKEGREAIREVRTRIGQSFFRKMIMSQYQTQCCVTGLNIPEVLRASHITSWADDKKNRLNPANGLCLSATYDAAFDRHLISFDDEYRMILSSSLKEYCTNEAFKQQFKKLEGLVISMPQRFPPDKALLGDHRGKMLMWWKIWVAMLWQWKNRIQIEYPGRTKRTFRVSAIIWLLVVFTLARSKS